MVKCPGRDGRPDRDDAAGRPTPDVRRRRGLLTVYGEEAVAAWLWPGLRGGVRTKSQVRNLVELDLAHWRAHGFGPWVFFDRDGDRAPVGRCGLRHTVVAGTAEVEVLWSVASARWREGLAKETEASARVAFGELGLDEVVAFAVVDNLASRGVMRTRGSPSRAVRARWLPVRALPAAAVGRLAGSRCPRRVGAAKQPPGSAHHHAHPSSTGASTGSNRLEGRSHRLRAPLPGGLVTSRPSIREPSATSTIRSRPASILTRDTVL